MDQDLFNRHRFAENIIGIIDSVPTPFTIGLDAKWGSGKTFFVNNVLDKAAKKKKIPYIVYDAFEHEKESDVLISVVTSILEQLRESNAESTSLNEVVLSVAKKTAKIASSSIKVIGNAATRFVLKSSLEEITDQFQFDSETEDFFSQELEKQVAKFIINRSTEKESYKQIKKMFQKSIATLANTVSETNKIIVVIDELDRCTPKHALSIFEAVHHLLNTSGLIFIFAFQKEQIERMIEHSYGAGTNASEYLKKFIICDMAFPVVNREILRTAHKTLAKQQISTYSDKNIEFGALYTNCFQNFNASSHQIGATPRDVKHFSSMLVLAIHNCNISSQFLSNRDFSLLVTWKVMNPKSLKELVTEGLNDMNREKFKADLQIGKLTRHNESADDFILKFLLGEPLDASTEQYLMKCINELVVLSNN